MHNVGLKIGAIVLAAGASRRMGQPKMLLPFGSSTVLGTVVTNLHSAGVDPLVVVVGGAKDKVVDLVHNLPFPVNLAENPDFAKNEMLDSLRIGLAALPEDIDAFLIALGDQPHVNTEVITAILNNYRETGAALIIPSYEMRRGHPWLVIAAMRNELKALSGSQTLRDFLTRHSSEIQYLVVDNAAILEDLDTPEDYHRAVRRSR